MSRFCLASPLRLATVSSRDLPMLLRPEPMPPNSWPIPATVFWVVSTGWEIRLPAKITGLSPAFAAACPNDFGALVSSNA